MNTKWEMIAQLIWTAANPVLTAAVSGAAATMPLALADPSNVDWKKVLSLGAAGAVIGIVNLYRKKPGGQS